MKKRSDWATYELESVADQLSGRPTAQQLEEARNALRWCAKVISAADEVVRKEAAILGSARRRAAAAMGGEAP